MGSPDTPAALLKGFPAREFFLGGKRHAEVVPRGCVGGRVPCVVVPAAAAKQRPQDRLNAYTVVTTAKQLAAFEEKGLDVADSRFTARGVKAQMILTRSQVQDVRADGASAKLTRVKGGKTVKQFAAAQAANGFTVWKSYDEPGGYRDQMHALASKYPQRHQARQDRHHAEGPRDPRAQGHAGRARPA